MDLMVHQFREEQKELTADIERTLSTTVHALVETLVNGEGCNVQATFQLFSLWTQNWENEEVRIEIMTGFLDTSTDSAKKTKPTETDPTQTASHISLFGNESSEPLPSQHILNRAVFRMSSEHQHKLLIYLNSVLHSSQPEKRRDAVSENLLNEQEGKNNRRFDRTRSMDDPDSTSRSRESELATR
ncbi:hypothetical protein BLNAU_17337 [Blattamonas nauphoetae]|uniref:Uncharacterized protein n=1 Tax=Blattamonas nauphoetae TaxID=2049346 RepID=A0ABQ9X7J8_9EUKA|nr:hypothetical protein BLNAU_17337 [Blattamonas nauphoetae]